MNTAVTLIRPDESVAENPEYIIPSRIPFEGSAGSEPDQPRVLYTEPTELNAEAFGNIPKISVAPIYLSPLKGKFKLLQLWEGRVTDIRDDEFDAIISDKTNPDFFDELVTIDSVELSPDDAPLLKEGAVFYWSIGYLDYPGRGRVRESKLRFRRLKGWTEKEIQQAKRIGRQFAQFFEQDPVCSSPAR